MSFQALIYKGLSACPQVLMLCGSCCPKDIILLWHYAVFQVMKFYKAVIIGGFLADLLLVSICKG